MLGSAMAVKYEVIRQGASLGSVLAVVLSYSHNHSILWAIIHGIMSWFYVVFAALFH